jgi:hypothetical protein
MRVSKRLSRYRRAKSEALNPWLLRVPSNLQGPAIALHGTADRTAQDVMAAETGLVGSRLLQRNRALDFHL